MNELLLNCCLCNKLRFRYSTSQSSVALMKWVENSQKLTNNSIFEWFSLVSEDGNSDYFCFCGNSSDLTSKPRRSKYKQKSSKLRGVKLIFDGSL